jgi:hypothetical protein
MVFAAITLAIIFIALLLMANRFVKDARAIRKELSGGATLKELNDMTQESREQLLSDYDSITTGLGKRIDKLEKLNREAESMAHRLENMLNSERLKTLEERGILFAIEAGENHGGSEADKHRRIADLLRGGASIEEVARITEASVREVELVKLLLKRGEKAEGA